MIQFLILQIINSNANNNFTIQDQSILIINLATDNFTIQKMIQFLILQIINPNNNITNSNAINNFTIQKMIHFIS
jgi:hypothetical protein